MKFGRLTDISTANLTLPPDHPMTSEVLRKSTTPPKIYVGCPVWGDKRFVGKIYPKGTKAKDFLKVYSTKFNAIELNATGYGIPSYADVEAWKNEVVDGFVFCPKVSRPISHVSPLAKDKAALKLFCNNMYAFAEHLGTVFLQLPPYFSSQRLPELLKFFDQWDKTLPLHVELRHPDWFENREILDTLFEAMRERNIGTVITDPSGRRDVLHQCLTTSSAFIRFDAHDLHPTDFTRLDEWAERIKQWIDSGLQQLYFFVHTPEKHLTPDLSNYFVKRLNALCGFSLRTAEIDQPGSDGLFG
jgi:uncharacterized protein YecE (DUF72 family)